MKHINVSTNSDDINGKTQCIEIPFIVPSKTYSC